ncbi:MAG: hypothetical protein IRZ03_13650 [Acidobacterium ailaaui]|jgi:hypothetical protein|nr:hypothetical protein [Pseudacidobacterium ailaaui]
MKHRKTQADYIKPSKSTNDHSSNMREKDHAPGPRSDGYHPGEKYPGSYAKEMEHRDGRGDGGPYLQGGTNQGRVKLEAHDPNYVPDYSSKGQAFICSTFPNLVNEEQDEYLGGYRK